MSSPINNTILNSLSFLQKCYFTAWLGTDLFLVVERSKDITNVKLLPSLAAKIVYLLFTCEIHDTRHFMLRNSAYVLSKLILKLSQVLFARYKMPVTLNDLVGFALILHVIRRSRGWKARFISTSQPQADFHPEISIARLPNRTPDELKG